MESNLNLELLEQFKNNKYLVNCGTKNNLDYDFKFIQQKNVNKALKSLKSDTFQTLMWSKYQDVGSHMNVGIIKKTLKINPNGLENPDWNIIGGELRNLKSEIDSWINKDLGEGAINKQFADEVNHMICHRLQTEPYEFHYVSEFYRHVEAILLSGHIPCGWVGVYNKGIIVVH